MSDEAKQELRRRLKARRAAEDAASRQAADELIMRNVLATPAFQKTSILLPYLSFGSEIDTRALIEAAWSAGKRVALPRCLPKGGLAWHVVDGFEGLIASSFGMEEPDPRTCALFDAEDAACTDEALAIVPGLAFDRQGYRLGYGGGFYDRFLARFKGTSMGLCRDERRFDDLRQADAIGPYDVPVHVVVTESGAYSSKPISST